MKPLIVYVPETSGQAAPASRQEQRDATRWTAEKVQVLTDGRLLPLPAREPVVLPTEAPTYLIYRPWQRTLPPEIAAFLRAHSFAGKWIAPLALHRGEGLGHSVEDILLLAEGAGTLEGIAFEADSIELQERKILKWVERTYR